ncbi:putative amino acid permease YhdG [Pandoraea terrigena]|uniref:Putative amino acid permease YhdG n=1 Tax=Pandoraea terrigena TaxID=2508292 RepID=A0A5E4TAB8_9BURK|nr:putative amino acid permease YhdG [Pandoraea terrigena]
MFVPPRCAQRAPWLPIVMPHPARATRVPGAPVVPLISAGLCLFLMAHLQATTWIAFVVWLVIGLGIYFLYARRNALLHTPSDARPAPR